MYKEKIEKHLRENGWQTHWNENVWIHGYVSGYLEHKRYIGSISPLTEAHV